MSGNTALNDVDLEAPVKDAQDMDPLIEAPVKKAGFMDVKNLCRRIVLALKDPIFLLMLCLTLFLIFSWGPHEVNGYRQAHANIFRRLGDMLHLLSFFVLLLKLYRHQSATGVSVTTQQMLLAVFVTRYLDLSIVHISTYNTMMKILYICLTAFIVCIIRFVEPWKDTCDYSKDSFPAFKFLIIPTFLAACVISESFPQLTLERQAMEVLWEFSIYLEAVAIIPQLALVMKSGEVEKYMLLYITLRGMYRALYVANWLTRAQMEQHLNYEIDWSVFVAGCLQTLPFLYFFVRMPKVKK